IQRHDGEAEATRIDGASEVEEAVFPSAKIQLRGDGEDIDQGSTLRVSNGIAPGQRLPLTEKSRSACASAASSLTSTHGSRCGGARTGSPPRTAHRPSDRGGRADRPPRRYAIDGPAVDDVCPARDREGQLRLFPVGHD